jgi:hypothetical protein
MFSDESTFRLTNPRAQKVRRPTLVKSYKQCYIVIHVKHLASVMVWGCFSAGDQGSLSFLPIKTTMNVDRYIFAQLTYWRFRKSLLVQSTEERR